MIWVYSNVLDTLRDISRLMKNATIFNDFRKNIDEHHTLRTCTLTFGRLTSSTLTCMRSNQGKSCLQAGSPVPSIERQPLWIIFS